MAQCSLLEILFDVGSQRSARHALSCWALGMRLWTKIRRSYIDCVGLNLSSPFKYFDIHRMIKV
jgi:hypothetical protein